MAGQRVHAHDAINARLPWEGVVGACSPAVADQLRRGRVQLRAALGRACPAGTDTRALDRTVTCASDTILGAAHATARTDLERIDGGGPDVRERWSAQFPCLPGGEVLP